MKKWFSANNITFLRIAFIPVIVVLLYVHSEAANLAAAIIFMLAAVTDMFDGLVARKFNQVSNLGKFLDPIADKLLITSVIIMLVGLGRVPAWVAILIIARELAISALRSIASEQRVVIGADRFGKIKTVMQVFALLPLIIFSRFWGIDFTFWGMIILYVALVLTIVSGVNYFLKFYRVLGLSNFKKERE